MHSSAAPPRPPRPPRHLGPVQVGYLTVSEGWVEAGQSQRRGGAHVELAKGAGVTVLKLFRSLLKRNDLRI